MNLVDELPPGVQGSDTEMFKLALAAFNTVALHFQKDGVKTPIVTAAAMQSIALQVCAEDPNVALNGAASWQRLAYVLDGAMNRAEHCTRSILKGEPLES